MLRVPPSAFCIEKVWKRKANRISCVNVDASAFRIEEVQKQKAKCISFVNVEASAFCLLHSRSAEVESQSYKLCEC